VRRHLPETRIDVVEIDRVVLEVAEEHLGFRRDPQLVVHLQDGRRFMESGGGDARWSVIALDAYGPDHIPEHLATRGFYDAVRARLAPGGLVIMNLWSEYASARYFDMLRTIEDVFAEVHVIAPARSESRVVIAFKEAVGLSKEELVARATELKKAWRLRFDLAAMIRRGHAGPNELPQGGTVIEDKKNGLSADR
jgi:spermidine synthase